MNGHKVISLFWAAFFAAKDDLDWDDPGRVSDGLLNTALIGKDLEPFDGGSESEDVAEAKLAKAIKDADELRSNILERLAILEPLLEEEAELLEKYGSVPPKDEKTYAKARDLHAWTSTLLANVEDRLKQLCMFSDSEFDDRDNGSLAWKEGELWLAAAKKLLYNYSTSSETKLWVLFMALSKGDFHKRPVGVYASADDAKEAAEQLLSCKSLQWDPTNEGYAVREGNFSDRMIEVKHHRKLYRSSPGVSKIMARLKSLQNRRFFTEVCPACNGTGHYNGTEAPCFKCTGTGIIGTSPRVTSPFPFVHWAAIRWMLVKAIAETTGIRGWWTLANQAWELMQKYKVIERINAPNDSVYNYDPEKMFFGSIGIKARRMENYLDMLSACGGDRYVAMGFMLSNEEDGYEISEKTDKLSDIVLALVRCEGNKSAASVLCGLPRSTYRYRLNKALKVANDKLDEQLISKDEHRLIMNLL